VTGNNGSSEDPECAVKVTKKEKNVLKYKKYTLYTYNIHFTQIITYYIYSF
jgi:hypothetical protein